MADAYASVNPQIGQGGLSALLPPDLRAYMLNFGDPSGAGFWDYLGQQRSGGGVGGRSQESPYNFAGNDSFSRFVQGDLNRQLGRWSAASVNDPGLGFREFLDHNYNPQADFNMLTPQQQGFQSGIVTPRGRMVLR